MNGHLPAILTISVSLGKYALTLYVVLTQQRDFS